MPPSVAPGSRHLPPLGLQAHPPPTPSPPLKLSAPGDLPIAAPTTSDSAFCASAGPTRQVPGSESSLDSLGLEDTSSASPVWALSTGSRSRRAFPAPLPSLQTRQAEGTDSRRRRRPGKARGQTALTEPLLGPYRRTGRLALIPPAQPQPAQPTARPAPPTRARPPHPTPTQHRPPPAGLCSHLRSFLVSPSPKIPSSRTRVAICLSPGRSPALWSPAAQPLFPQATPPCDHAPRVGV
ncbi:uncharacterized protein LOC127210099 [Acomys russatus]|uniref:uncharacterized protein LOC127210099 n=1 Tax=Acomys russatus TaxID=60746 RepID=UPI0021E27AB2|nr:uncharacterized protein LOC127210099 [Acomys russatus]